MNIIGFISTLLKMNPDFDESEINRFMCYFQELTKGADRDLNHFLTTDKAIFQMHVDDLIKYGKNDKYWEENHKYGYDGLEIEDEYDGERIVSSLVKTDSDEYYAFNERILFKLSGVRITSFGSDPHRVFWRGIALIQDNNGKWGIVNKFGKILKEPYYDGIIDRPIGDYLVAAKNDKYGILDLKGNEVVPLIYDFITNDLDYEMHYTESVLYGYADGYLVIRKGDKRGLLNKDLDELLPCIYKNIYSFQGYDYRYHDEVYFIIQDDTDIWAIYQPDRNRFTSFKYNQVYLESFRWAIPFKCGEAQGFYQIKTGKEYLLNFPFDLDDTVEIDYGYIQIRHKEVGLYAVFDKDLRQLTDFGFNFPVAKDRYNFWFFPANGRDVPDSPGIKYTDESFFKNFGLKTKP